MKRCSNCVRSWVGEDRRTHCGAPVDDAALHGAEGINPIWAERKYGEYRIRMLLAGNPVSDEGTDCENMDPHDGAHCVMWKAQP